jgi:hypothetical protein
VRSRRPSRPRTRGSGFIDEAIRSQHIPDGIGGTADDVDYDFGDDTLFPNEGFTGIEDTLNTTAWGLSKGKAR